MKNKLKPRIFWWLHFFIVLIALGLFFVPQSLWPKKIMFHFYYLWGIILIQIISGLIYYPREKKFYFACPLTELEKKYDKNTKYYKIGESCIGHFCHEKLGLPYRLGTISTITALIIVTIQFLN